MAATAFLEYGVVAARITVASCTTGDAVAGASNAYITDSVESAKHTRDIIAGEIKQPLQGGFAPKVAYRIITPDVVSGANVEFTALKKDRYLQSMFTNGSFLLDSTNDNGYIEETGPVTRFFFLELWQDQVQNGCESSGLWKPYRRHIYGLGRPKVPDDDFGRDVAKFMGKLELTPFRPPTAWLGPHDDLPAGFGTQITAWLAANPTKKTFHIDWDEATLPTAFATIGAGFIAAP